ncbi:MAG: hypothetical protein ACOCQD_02765 [archaeon]
MKVERVIISYTIERECINPTDTNDTPKPVPYDILQLLTDIGMGDAMLLESSDAKQMMKHYGVYRFLMLKDGTEYELKVWLVRK